MRNAELEIGIVPGMSPEAFRAMYTLIDICNLLQKSRCCRIRETTLFNGELGYAEFENYPYVKDGNYYEVYHANIFNSWPHVDGVIRLTEAEFEDYFYKIT